MNSHSQLSNTHHSRSKRESLGRSEKENADYRNDRQSYIAECKRLLSGLRGCQM
jgi:hypothetical protein